MSFEVIKVIQGTNPVDDNSKVDTLDSTREVKSASTFDEEISTVKGMNSRWCYCPKLSYGLDGEVVSERPSIKVIGDEYIHLEKQPCG
jgi:hypothetical protein